VFYGDPGHGEVPDAREHGPMSWPPTFGPDAEPGEGCER
jgi:hypothetical protein